MRMASLIAALGVSALLLLSIRVPLLEVVEPEGGKILFRMGAERGTEFSTSWVHSVEFSLVEEFYRVGEEGRIYLEATRFRSHGAGLPLTPPPGGRFIVEEGAFLIDGIHRPLREILLRVDENARNSLKAGEVSLALWELAPGGLVGVRVRRRVLLRLTLASLMNSLP